MMTRHASILPWVVICSLLTVGPVSSYTMDNMNSLVKDLFTNYTLMVRPFDDHTRPTAIDMTLSLSAIQDLNEIEQSLKFSAWIYLTWTDPRLAWTPSSYNGTDVLTYPQKHMWIPDVTIENTLETMGGLGFDMNSLYVTSTGGVHWLPSGVFMTSCDIDVTFYPFDTQVCSVIFTTVMSKKGEVDLNFVKKFSASLENYSQSGTWELVSFAPGNISDAYTHSRISFDITLRRMSKYYELAILTPVIFLSLTATLVFALPADSGEKMGTSITVLLAFAVYLTIVSDQMPRTSLHVSLLSVYLNMLLGQTAVGVVLSVWVLNLHHRDDARQPPKPYLLRIAHLLRSLICRAPLTDKVTPMGDEIFTMTLQDQIRSLRNEEDKVPRPPSQASDQQEPEMMSWKDVAFTFDRFLFYCFSVFIVVVTVIFMFVLKIGGGA